MQLPHRYPRIYSLSTVGIIFHGDCDYVLHPHCTSFAGDSGVGKSIVADLLQLLFAGPGVYKSATQGQKARPLTGLVANGLAYVYATIELTHRQYVGLGCYLETTGTAHPFLVYHGFRDDNLGTFAQPLGFRDFLIDGNIKPYKVWAEHLRLQSQGLFTQAFVNNYRRYHEVLHKNGILPLDVGSNDGLLKNYAKIIRSFARSGELERGDIDYLEFLFGKDAETAIWAEYQKLLQEFEQDGREQHGHNMIMREIEAKVTDFRQLLVLQQKAHSARLAFATDKVQYCRYQVTETQRKVTDLRHKYQEHSLSYFKLHTELLHRKAVAANQNQLLHEQAATQKPVLEKKISRFEAAIAQTKQDENLISEQLTQLTQQHQNILRVERWLAGPFGPTPADIVQAQQQQEQRRVENRRLANFLAYLEAHGLAASFITSAWACDAPDTDHRARLKEMQQRLLAVELLQKFNDLQDEESLTRWALELKVPLSTDQESILAHFSSLPKLRARSQEFGARYLADPVQLLALPLPYLVDSEKPGFWLNLRGVGEWIPRLNPAQCVFFDTDASRIEKLLNQRAATAGQSAHELRQQLDAELHIHTTLINYENWQGALSLYARQNELIASIETDSLPEGKTLREILSQYANRVQISQNLQAIKHEHEAASGQRIEHELNLSTAKQHLLDCDKVLQANTRIQLIAQVKQITDEQKGLQSELAKWLQENNVSTESYSIYLVSTINDSLQDITTEKLLTECATHNTKREDTRNLVITAEKELPGHESQAEDAEQEFQEVTGQEFIVTGNDLSQLTAPDETIARQTKQDYETQFGVLAAPLGLEGKRLKPTELVALIQRSVPEAVKTYLEQPEEALHELLAYLEEVNAQSTQLAENKLTRLGELLNRVRTKTQNYTTEIKELESYFRQSEASIAGGFNAVLRVKTIAGYDWLYHFQDALQAKVRGDADAFNALRQHERLQELMVATYIDQGGKNQRATARELLNPRYYLHLTYQMEVEGQVNSGSNGQTFMAAALLNIARLSLIGREGRQQRRRSGVRFMPIDEAAGLGSNYANLLKLAWQQGYQVISLAIEPVVDSDFENVSEQCAYILGASPNPKNKLNLLPMMIKGSKTIPIDEDAFYKLPPDLFTPLDGTD